MNEILKDPRFSGIEPFPSKLWLSSPTMHGDEQKWVDEAILTNWVSTLGANIDAVGKQVRDFIGVSFSVPLSTGTAALHLASRLAGEKLYGRPKAGHGALEGKTVFATDMTFAATVNPIAYEGGNAVFIDSETDTWNMSPEALEKAFELYPETRLVVIAHLYGTPAKMEELKAVCERHGALIIEDAAESFAARYQMNGEWVETGSLGDLNCISFNGNKIITGSAGGMFLTNSEEDAQTVCKWSTQSREDAPWYQHEDLGYNYRMSNIIAGVIRGQLAYIREHLEQKRVVWERYEAGLAGLPLCMNPWDREKSEPNFWLSCLLIDEDAMAPQTREDCSYSWQHVSGKSSPQEILDAFSAFNIDGRPIWKPMHLQPVYREHDFVTAEGNLLSKPDLTGVGDSVFRRGLCLPSDNKMTPEQQDRVIDIIRRCFQ